MRLGSAMKVTKGKLGGITFMYNPTAFTDNQGVNWNELTTAGMSYPAYTYGGGKARTITFVIYLNDKVQPKITDTFMRRLEKYLPTPSKKGYLFKAPSTIQFAFGSFVKDCKLVDMNCEVISFSPALVPIEANVSVTLNVIQ